MADVTATRSRHDDDASILMAGPLGNGWNVEAISEKPFQPIGRYSEKGQPDQLAPGKTRSVRAAGARGGAEEWRKKMIG